VNRQMLCQAAAIPAASASANQAAAQEPALPVTTGTDALLFQDDPQFWFEISRLFRAADYGGALLGEVIDIAKSIKSGDYGS
jgi:hypothetical protein